MNSDFKLSLHWYAKDKRWWAVADNGDFRIANNLSDIPRAVAGMMRGQAHSMEQAAKEVPL